MSDANLFLLGDIGGTNIRLALWNGTALVAEQRFDWPAPPDLPATMHSFLKAHAATPQHAALSIAAPLQGDVFEVTNVLLNGHMYSCSGSEIKAALGLQSLQLLNDAAAIALSLPHLQPHEKVQVGGGTPQQGAPMALVAPGTGLGTACLVFANSQPIALPAQGGHVTMAAANAREAAVLGAMRARHPHISAERVCSGMGLPSLYKGVAAVQGKELLELTASAIAERALNGGDEVASETLQMFFAMLGTVASNVALTLGAHGGIYLGGGILPRLLPQFMASNFRTRFEEKGRYRSYMEAIPTFVITAPNPAFTGLQSLLKP